MRRSTALREHPRIGRWLGDRPLQLLDPGEAALETTGHF
jgi:hypothetical protein